MVTRVLLELKSMGISVNTNVYTTDDAVQAIMLAKNGGKNNG